MNPRRYRRWCSPQRWCLTRRRRPAPRSSIYSRQQPHGESWLRVSWICPFLAFSYAAGRHGARPSRPWHNPTDFDAFQRPTQPPGQLLFRSKPASGSRVFLSLAARPHTLQWRQARFRHNRWRPHAHRHRACPVQTGTEGPTFPHTGNATDGDAPLIAPIPSTIDPFNPAVARSRSLLSLNRSPAISGRIEPSTPGVSCQGWSVPRLLQDLCGIA